MKRQSSKANNMGESRGYILALMIFVVALLFTVAGVAIDLGNIYRWNVRLERAARAGVAAGLGYRTLKGWRPLYGGVEQSNNYLAIPGAYGNSVVNTTGMAELKDAVTSAVLDNFSSEFAKAADVDNGKDSGGAPVFAPPVVNFDPIEDRVSVSLSYKVPVLLVNRIFLPGFGAGCEGKRCSAVANVSAQLRPATVAMVLDTSGSMICPKDSNLPDCPCRTTKTCDLANSKIVELRKAAQDFTKYFNPFRDRIALIPFNTGAAQGADRTSFFDGTKPAPFGKNKGRYDAFMTRLTDIGESSSGTSSTAIETRLPPVGNTNHCDGLVSAFQEIAGVLSNPPPGTDPADIRPFTVFFTDGAPNGMIGAWQDDYDDRLKNPAKTTEMLNPWYQYSIDWSDSSPIPKFASYRGPSPLLYQPSASLFNFQISSTGTTPKIAPLSMVPKGQIFHTQPEFQKTLDGSKDTQAPLKTLRFTVPLAGAPVVTISDPTKSGPPDPDKEFKTDLPGGGYMMNTEQLYYFCPISAADYHRTVQNGLVFVVGVGQPAKACNDPAQDVDNAFLRKDALLRRIAADEIAIEPSGNNWKEGAMNYRFSPRRLIKLSSKTECADHRFIKATGGYDYEFGYFGGAAPPAEQLRGNYFSATNALQLREMFRLIAKSILLRLEN